MDDAVSRHNPLRSACLLLGLGPGLLLNAASAAQAPGAASAAPATSASAPAPRQVQSTRIDTAAWQKLSPAQRLALAPLERDWSRFEEPHKAKWLEIAQRLPSMPPEERERIQARMTEWARMTPVERGQARLRYLQARRTAPDDLDARWQDYQALPTDQKKQLAARSAVPASAPGTTRKAVAERSARLDRADVKGVTEKSNLVTNPNFSAPPRTVAPTVIQARPGATTTLVSKQPSPPPHQQTGLPKIAASGGFVDKSTLLPQRGPQGAAALSVHAVDPDGEPVPRP